MQGGVLQDKNKKISKIKKQNNTKVDRMSNKLRVTDEKSKRQNLHAGKK